MKVRSREVVAGRGGSGRRRRAVIVGGRTVVMLRRRRRRGPGDRERGRPVSRRLGIAVIDGAPRVQRRWRLAGRLHLVDLVRRRRVHRVRVVLVGWRVVEYRQYVIDGVVFLDVGVVDRQRGYQHHVVVIVVGGRVFVVVVVISVTLFGCGRLDGGRGRSGLPDVGHGVRGLGHRRRRRRRIRRLLDGGRRVTVIHFGRNLVVGERLLMVIMMVLMLVVVTAVRGVLLHDVRHVGHRRQPVAVGLHQGCEVTEQIVRPVSVLHGRPVAVHQYGVGHRLLER